MGIINKALAQTWVFPTLNANNFNNGTTFANLLSVVMVWVFALAGIVAFFFLVFSGFVYLTAGGNPDAAKKGQQGIINAIIGLVIIFLAYAIVVAVMNLLSNVA